MGNVPPKDEPRDSRCMLLGGASSHHFPWVGRAAIFNAQHRFKDSREAETLLRNECGSSHLKAEIFRLPGASSSMSPEGDILSSLAGPKDTGGNWELWNLRVVLHSTLHPP